MLRKIFLGVICILVPFVQAQDEIEEIIVLAQKKEQTLQEVPVAVSVVDAEVIQRAQINDPIDLQTIVPSLQVTQLQSSKNTNFLIRGFGNGANNSGIEPSVGVFVDGVYRSRTFSVLNELPHLERVEVLRGPQSTLFGKNASAGVINIVTRLQIPERWQAHLAVYRLLSAPMISACCVEILRYRSPIPSVLACQDISITGTDILQT